MCTSDLNPFSSNNILVRGTLAAATMGGSELARKSYQAAKPPPAPSLPALPEPPQAAQGERAPTIAAPKRKPTKGAATPSPTSTALTGPLGIDPSQLIIGRNALLGQ
jgi:hypothetical protein